MPTLKAEFFWNLKTSAAHAHEDFPMLLQHVLSLAFGEIPYCVTSQHVPVDFFFFLLVFLVLSRGRKPEIPDDRQGRNHMYLLFKIEINLSMCQRCLNFFHKLCKCYIKFQIHFEHVWVYSKSIYKKMYLLFKIVNTPQSMF